MIFPKILAEKYFLKLAKYDKTAYVSLANMYYEHIDKFENNSDEYVEINLNRKVTELSSVLYEKN